jgi:hypothetical protein
MDLSQRRGWGRTIVSASWELTINTFPPGQVLKEYYQAEAMGDVNGVLSCTAVHKKQQNLLCSLSRCTERSDLLDLQFDSAVSGLGNRWLK